MQKIKKLLIILNLLLHRITKLHKLKPSYILIIPHRLSS
jgi:hypothetical protein